MPLPYRLYRRTLILSMQSRSDEESREIGRASGILASSTMLSRILGLVRNQILSHFFGAGIASDAFIAAFTIPNALRRLFGEGGLTPAFVSIFTRVISDSQGDRERARAFLSDCFMWLSLLLLLIVAVGIGISPWLVQLYVPQFSEIPGKFELTVELTRFLFPFILLISWAALFMGILNTYKRFYLPAIGPAVLNLSVITLAPLLLLFAYPNTENGIFIFAGCILIGVSVQLVIHLPVLHKLHSLPKLRWQFKLDPRLLDLGRMLLPAVFSLGIYQLNIIVNRVFASGIPGAVSHLYYSDLILELPVSLIATSMSVAAMPSFSRLYVEGNRQELGRTFFYSIGLNASLALPATGGLLILALPCISSIFQTGAFTYNDTLVASQALFFYALGLPFYCLIRSLLPLYFAAKDTKTPAIAAFVALSVNFVAAWQLSKDYGAPGIAAATSIASLCNFALLLAIAIKRFPEFPWMKILSLNAKVILGALIMSAGIYFLGDLVPEMVWVEQGISLRKVLYLVGLVLSGIVIYFVATMPLKIEPLEQLRAKIYSVVFRAFKK